MNKGREHGSMDDDRIKVTLKNGEIFLSESLLKKRDCLGETFLGQAQICAIEDAVCISFHMDNADTVLASYPQKTVSEKTEQRLKQELMAFGLS